MRILVIEDEQEIADFVVRGLREEGFVVEQASDGQEGVRKALAWQPEAAVVDLGLPLLDGYEVARRLRALGRQPRPLLVAVTGLPSEADGRRSVEAGIDLHLVKPADPHFLVTLLRRHAELSRPAGG